MVGGVLVAPRYCASLLLELAVTTVPGVAHYANDHRGRPERAVLLRPQLLGN